MKAVEIVAEYIFTRLTEHLENRIKVEPVALIYNEEVGIGIAILQVSRIPAYIYIMTNRFAYACVVYIMKD
jgi:hypothetical protein